MFGGEYFGGAYFGGGFDDESGVAVRMVLGSVVISARITLDELIIYSTVAGSIELADA
jgi:hypothetical protein